MYSVTNGISKFTSKNIGHANSAISTHGAIPSTQGTISSTVNTQTMNVSTSETSRISTGGTQSTMTGLTSTYPRSPSGTMVSSTNGTTLNSTMDVSSTVVSDVSTSTYDKTVFQLSSTGTSILDTTSAEYVSTITNGTYPESSTETSILDTTSAEYVSTMTNGIFPESTTLSSLIRTTLNGTLTNMTSNGTPTNLTSNETLTNLTSNLPSNLNRIDPQNSNWMFGRFKESYPCDSLECIIVDRYRYYTYDVLVKLSILLGIVGLIGAIGNILVIMVFARNRVKRNSTYFMLTLAIIDLMVCTIVIPGVIAREWRAVFYSDVLCKGLEFMRSLMIPSSALILVAIALDRFFLICISTKEIMTTFVAKIVILVIMLLGMSLGIPPLLSVGLLKDNEGSYLPICVKSDEYLNDTSQYHYWYFVSGLFAVMIVAILILYLLIFKKVIQQSNRWKNRTNKIFPERRNTHENLHGRTTIEPISSQLDSTDRKGPSNNTNIAELSTVTEHDTIITNKETPIAPQPSTSATCDTKPLKMKNSKQGISINSNTNIKTLSDMKRRSTHVKTTQVLFIVTLVYIFSFLPTFLETNEVIPDNKYLTYVYFVNNAANPIIYSFMNAKFREEAKRLYCKCFRT